MSHGDWVFGLKARVKQHRRLATLLFYLTDLLYLDLRERTSFVSSFPAGARLLNLGAGFRTSPRGFLGVDRTAYPGIGLVADLAQLPLAAGRVDGVLCEMVLEHVEAPGAVLAEIARVLKPGGRAYLAIPFLWPYHASPHDYHRWTREGAALAIPGLETLDVGISGGPTTALVNVFHEWLCLALSFNVDWIYRALYLVLLPLLLPLKLPDLVLARYRNAHRIAALLYLHVRRANATP